ncbi:MAG: hypothetical protein VKJ24_05815 [Synechococcales bacterium]|nr:hypothetical protein [Synechococcales bacterium]
MGRSQILDPTKSYTFSKYADLAFETADILMEFGVTLVNQALPSPHPAPIDSQSLQAELQENLTLVNPSSEIARRECLIFPILKRICQAKKVSLRIEYPVRVDAWLKGSFDYFIPDDDHLLVIEAKNADLARGFTQLAVELIALDRWTTHSSSILFGAVTTGDTWKFGSFHRRDRFITKDINTYAIPSDLDRILAYLYHKLRSTEETPPPHPSEPSLKF